MESLAIYRREFRPSPTLAEPYVMVGVPAMAAETDERAEFLATSMYLRSLGIVRGDRTALQPPVESMDGLWSAAEQLALAERMALMVVGGPDRVKADLQEIMQNLVGLIRTESELKEAVKKIEGLKQRAAKVRVEGGRVYNAGWHTALDLRSLLTVAECSAMAALERTESRGGHTRDDHPYTDDTWGKINVVLRLRAGRIQVSREPLPEMPAELKALFQERK